MELNGQLVDDQPGSNFPVEVVLSDIHHLLRARLHWLSSAESEALAVSAKKAQASQNISQICNPFQETLSRVAELSQAHVIMSMV